MTNLDTIKQEEENIQQLSNNNDPLFLENVYINNETQEAVENKSPIIIY